MSLEQKTSAAWERHRECICDLYRNNTLRVVMQVMDKDYRFQATPRMYKQRLGEWGLYKNNRLKSSSLRKEMPQLAPPAMLTAMRPIGWKVPQHVLSTIQDKITEQIIVLAQRSARESYNVKRWPVDLKTAFRTWKKVAVLAVSLYQEILDACTLFSQGTIVDNHEATLRLEVALTGIEDMARFDCRFLDLPRLLLVLCRNEERPEISALILKSLIGFRELHHGPSDPVYQFCRLLATLDGTVLVDALERALVATHHASSDEICTMHRQSLEAAIEADIHVIDGANPVPINHSARIEYLPFDRVYHRAMISSILTCDRTNDLIGRTAKMQAFQSELSRPDYYRVKRTFSREDGTGDESGVITETVEAVKLKHMIKHILLWFEVWEAGEDSTLMQTACHLRQIVEDIPISDNQVDDRTTRGDECISMLEAMRQLATSPQSWSTWTQPG